ncbi:Exocyst subunit Exo70 family protein [Quillaja saponaria]|uniref:Exocyst subunit Exo70 family protein n=1 Tax=Quillaja saponaria TaxID=32244 RepID=A0AAD7KTZ7_QUISA|nr:Exocyst subunit Exo70 family protein [Quillaja saponaria]
MTTTATSLTGGGEDRVLATAQQIVLSTPKEVRQDMLLIFSSFDNRLSNISNLINGDDSKSSVEEDLDRLEAAEKIILRWDPSNSEEGSCHSSSLLDSMDDVGDYFSAVDDVLRLMNLLSMQPLDSNTEAVMERVENVIQLSMARLEDEFHHVLIRNTIPLDADRIHCSIRRSSLSFACNDGEIGENFESFGEVTDRGSGRFHERGASLGDNVCVDLINPDAIVELKEIADRMMGAGYERECLQVYSAVRRDALDECLAILGVEKLSIEEVQKVEWKSLDEKMKKWIQAVKIAVMVLLTGEKRLFDNIFGELDETKATCLNETAKGCVMQLLNFGEAVAIGKRSPEKLFRILDMYVAMRNVLPKLENIVSDEFVISEANGVLSGLGEAAKGTFTEFEMAVQNETSRKPMQNGEIHPLARYVMNYLRLLVDYGDPLNSLLECHEEDSVGLQNNDGVDDSQLRKMSPLGHRLLFLITTLESNIEEKSRLYEDNAMKSIFLMNNMRYIKVKVQDSELGQVLGDDWVRRRMGLIRQLHTSYLRASWSKALSCLKDEGVGGSSSNASKMALKERFKNFNACFEEIYRIQTAWKVPDEQLREELRISISETVLPAYRSFMGRFGSQLESQRHAGKYIKYTPDDLEKYLLDFFEGSPCVLNNTRRKGT